MQNRESWIPQGEIVMAKTNNVTLFSNGIGHFRRSYLVSAGKQESISIPFKTDCIGDVAASLQVFGKVRLNTPPSFTPANSFATALRIDQDDALKSMLRQLSGCQVKLQIRSQSTTDYTLLGLDHESVLSNGQEAQNSYVVAMRNGAVKRFLLTDVLDIEFEDQSVRTEIDKALKCNFQKIKPDSTMLDLSLSSLDDKQVEAIVQYTIPVAAWKMRYAIREDKGKFSLEGAAIIDNNTDEDWQNFIVSVVTGNPISFNTDIANVVVPQRKMVYLVDQVVQGNVDVEEGMYVQAACAAPSRKISRSTRSLGAKMSTANYAQFGLDANDEGQDGGLESRYAAAEAPGVESKDVGDFCVFTAKEPITILARKSAVVPMFSEPIDAAGVVLLYKESNNARRPYRAIKFQNETKYTLGRGKTVIYNEGLFSGECVLDNTKPGENRMLPHCLENGVKIVKENKGHQVRRSSLKLSEGVGATEEVQTATTAYIIENKKDEPFKVALEHVNLLTDVARVDFEGVDVKEKEKLVDSNGWRVYFELKPKEQKTLVVTETFVRRSSVVIGSNFNWVRNNIIDEETPIASDKQILVCVDIQKSIDEVDEELVAASNRSYELSEQVDRVRKNLSAAKDVTSTATTDKWVADLDTSETEIRQINKKTVPELNKKKKDLTTKLANELKKVTVSWNEK